jgi:uncharacterized protein YcgI (DUF1989 family)
MAPTTIPAGTGAHAILQSGQSIKIINPSGHQVIDCWAFPLGTDTRPRWMSMAQSRSALGKVIPSVGDTLIDTHRQPVVTLTEDTSTGVHDMLFPACDSWRYIRGSLLSRLWSSSQRPRTRNATNKVFQKPAKQTTPAVPQTCDSPSAPTSPLQLGTRAKTRLSRPWKRISAPGNGRPSP